MNEKLKKVKLKGNESFNFREGWLRKGMRCVAENEDLFSQDDVMERLGVGSKMVKSIRFWLQATHLTEEQYTNSGRSRSQFITEDFGEIIAEYDPYFDDLFTLFLVHYHIEMCIRDRCNTNRIPILVDGQRRGVVATFQDVKQLQNSEQKIRLKLHEKGLVAKYAFNDILGDSPACLLYTSRPQRHSLHAGH